MKLKVPHDARMVMAPVDELTPGRIRKVLFPAGRDWRRLKEEVDQNGYRLEHAIVVRPHSKSAGYEIIDGLGRAIIAGEKGLAQISALVIEMDEREALRYAVDANLYAGRTRTRLSLPQAITLAKAHEENGGEYRVAPILEACGVSEPTYKRAHSSLIFAVEKLREDHPELIEMSLAEVVSESVRRKLWRDFTDFYMGEIPPNTFREQHYVKSRKAEDERRRQKSYGARTTKEAGIGAHTSSQETNGAIPRKENSPWRSKPPNQLEILELAAGASPLSMHNLNEIERYLQGLSDKELSRIVNYVKTLNALSVRALDARRAARRRASLKGKKQCVLPYSMEAGDNRPSGEGERPKARSTRRARKSTLPLVSSAIH
ncbi:MAG: ParB N-terminal domain-containing protein [Pyrinomonadaceae bacterium]